MGQFDLAETRFSLLSKNLGNGFMQLALDESIEIVMV
jgi:hypothetical protein